MRIRTIMTIAVTLAFGAAIAPIGSFGSAPGGETMNFVPTASGPITHGDCGKACKWIGYWICNTPGDPDLMCATNGTNCADHYECSTPCQFPCN